jgi:hypothetical protein
MKHGTSRRTSWAVVVLAAVAALALPALGAGALANAGFERADQTGAQPRGWTTNAWAPTAVFAWDRSVARQGHRSVRIQAGEMNDAEWLQTVAVQPDTLYRLAGWIKTSQVARTVESVNAGANLGFFGSWDRSTAVMGTSGWTEVSATTYSGHNTQLTVAARLGYWSGVTTGTAWFDDLSLTAVAQPERIANPGFERGTHAAGAIPTGWGTVAAVGSSSSFAWDRAVSHSGKRSVRVTSATADDAMWVQSIPVWPNTWYELSGWIRTRDVAHSTDVLDPGANLSFLGTWDRSAPVFGTQRWTRVSVTTNSGTQAYLVIAARLGYWSGVTTGTAWFDDLTLTALG